jgi:hypothetical protein
MVKTRSLPSILIPIVVIAGIYFVRGSSNRFDEMHYRGKTYKLGKSYSSWEDFKDDPMIAADQLAAVQKAVESDKLTPVYTSRFDLIKGTFDIQFPGFGMATFGEHAGADGSMLAGYAINVPMADKDRVIVYRGKDDTWTLIDDFVWTPSEAIWKVDDKDGKLVYSGFDGKEAVTRDGR